MSTLTIYIDIDELGECECHAPWWRPWDIAVQDGNDGFAQQVGQTHLLHTQLGHNVLRGDARYCHL